MSPTTLIPVFRNSAVGFSGFMWTPKASTGGAPMQMKQSSFWSRGGNVIWREHRGEVALWPTDSVMPGGNQMWATTCAALARGHPPALEGHIYPVQKS